LTDRGVMSSRLVLEFDHEPSPNLLKIVFSEQNTGVRRPAIFLDRDGVINRRRPGDYVLNWSQFEFVPGIREALKQIASLGLPMIVISNQAAIGKGLLATDALQEINTRMRQTLLQDGTALTAAYYCPHKSEENCACRKPRPGLIYAAANDFNLDLSRSVFVGDSEADVEAARAAGCRLVLFCSDFGVIRNDLSVETRELVVTHRVEDLFGRVQKCLPSSVVNPRT
jgi:histidinol-phosphate phosphatase family protein